MKKRLLSLTLFAAIGLSIAYAEQPASQEYTRANKLFSQSRYSEALPLYQRLSSTHASNVPSGTLSQRIGDCFFQLGNYQNAIDAYRSALKNQKRAEQAPTQYWIGFSAFLLGNDAEAAAEFLKIPERYPESGMWVSTAYYWAGRVCERMGKKEQAAAYYHKAGGKGTSLQERFALKKAETLKKEQAARGK